MNFFNLKAIFFHLSSEDDFAKRNDEFLKNLLDDKILTIDEILDEEDILTTIRLKSEVFSN